MDQPGAASKWLDQVPHVERNDEGRDVWVLDGARVQQPRAHRGRGLAGAVPRRSEDLRGVPPGRVRRRRPPRVHGRGRHLGAGALPERRRLRQPALPVASATTSSSSCACAPTTTSSATGRRPTRVGCSRSCRCRSGTSTRRSRRSTRNLDAGHRGILFTGEPHRFGLPYLGEAHWDPLWSIAQEAGLPIHFHIGSGDMKSSFGPGAHLALRHRGDVRVHVGARCS